MALILLVVALLMAAMNINIASSSPDQQRASKKLALKVRPRVVINVLVNRRLESLKRLCESLLAADYMGDTNVALEFHLEAGQPASIRSYVVNFEWPLGPKVVHSRLVRAGLIAIAVESWYPTDDNEYGVLLEDDIEVSPHFYRWIQTALAAYTRAGSPANVLGVSLYTPRVVETAQGEQRRPISHRPFDPQGLIFNITGLSWRGLVVTSCSTRTFLTRPVFRRITWRLVNTSHGTTRITTRTISQSL